MGRGEWKGGLLRTMAEAFDRTSLLIEEAESRASLAELYNVSVTVLRQSTHVPKTSKKRPFGCGSWKVVVMFVTVSFLAVRCCRRAWSCEH